jgi:hypothetical protein
MFKQYVQAGHQSQPLAQQNSIGVDLTTITAYIRTPANSYTQLLGPGLNSQVHMTLSEFEEFLTNLKTANRLKRVYE